jgi:hypothetical protein
MSGKTSGRNIVSGDTPAYDMAMKRDNASGISKEIMEVLKFDYARVWSWGASDFCAVVYDNMPALRFTVQGFLFTGKVVVVLNEGADLYEIYCLDEAGNAVKSQTNVFIDELTEVIDRMVEKDSSQEEYVRRADGWLAETDNN